MLARSTNVSVESATAKWASAYFWFTIEWSIGFMLAFVPLATIILAPALIFSLGFYIFFAV